MSNQATAAVSTRDPETYPLHFKKHNFEAYCYNTQDCQVVYAGMNQSAYATGKPMSAPPSAEYQKKWPFASHVGIKNFPAPADVSWTTLSGEKLQTSIDLGEIFKDERVLHNVPEEQIPERAFTGPVPSPSIYLEVNDRTISVYMKVLIPTKDEQTPGNKNSHFRSDVIKAWSRTY
ncbi:MAG: hypothetical protein ABW178_03190 [Pseudoxanthomonas sp.]